MFRMAEVLVIGERKYGKDNWRGIPVEQQINHALQHLYAFLAGDQSDDHLGHAFCRCMMAPAVHLSGRATVPPQFPKEMQEWMERRRYDDND